MDRWLIYLHILFAFFFLLSHGGSVAVAFQVRKEKSLERTRALLELSTSSYTVMYVGLLGLLITGIVAGFVRDAWGHGWIWASLALLIVVAALMFYRGSSYYGKLRQAAGMEWFDGRKTQPAIAPAREADRAALLNSRMPEETTAIGGIGLALILWLMMFRPF
ncbi:MAG: hypothetical protein HY327_04170 [Chloroflexi bacterium]|nr:hypothetical protein [Chloroflexota bacterium]